MEQQLLEPLVINQLVQEDQEVLVHQIQFKVLLQHTLAVEEELGTLLQELDQVVQVEVETHLLMDVVVQGQPIVEVEGVLVLHSQAQQKQQELVVQVLLL